MSNWPTDKHTVHESGKLVLYKYERPTACADGHNWTWTGMSTANDTPPDDAVCECGKWDWLSYKAAKEEFE